MQVEEEGSRADGGQLTPRAASCLPEAELARDAFKTWLAGLGLYSAIQISSWFDSASDMVSEMPAEFRLYLQLVPDVYNGIERIAAAAVLGSARAEMLSDHPPQLWPSPSLKASSSASRLRPPETAIQSRRACKRTRNIMEKDATSAQMMETLRINAALDVAFELAEALVDNAPRLIRFASQGIAWDDQRDLLRPLFQRRASAASTLRMNVRTV
jgi:hypothetical protein